MLIITVILSFLKLFRHHFVADPSKTVYSSNVSSGSSGGQNDHGQVRHVFVTERCKHERTTL